MSNEIMNSDSFELVFEPARLEFENYDEMKKMVEKYAERYENLVFEPEDKKGLVQARSDLLALFNALETERKNVKRVYSEPLDEFEDKVKEMTKLIEKPLDNVRDGIRAIDEAQRDARRDALKSFLGGLIDGKGIHIDDIEIEDRWLNKGNWTDKFEPIGKLEAELENVVEQLVKEKEKTEHDIKVLTKYCESVDVEPSGWVEQLEFRSAMEIIELISKEIENKGVSSDLDEKAGKSSSEEEKHVTDEKNSVSGHTSYESNVITNTIQVTGTINQLNALNDYLVGSGILVVQVDD